MNTANKGRLAITITACDRLENLRMLVQSLANQSYIRHSLYKLYIHVEPISKPVIDFCKTVKLFDCDLLVHDVQQGVNKNTFSSMERALKHEGHLFNMYLEDDLLLSPDALRLYESYAERVLKLKNQKDQGIEQEAMLCMYTDEGNLNKSTFFESRRMFGWGFIMHRDTFFKVARPIWCAGSSMWDNRVAQAVREHGMHNIFPNLSRVTNTGRHGVHFTPEQHDRLVGNHIYHTGYDPITYDWNITQ